jgi:hypothetical protein
VESLESFQRNRAVIEDFSSRTLAAIPTDFGRLCYIHSLKDTATGRYEHEGLASLYSEGAVEAALSHCHEELFARILETPLREQERDLDAFLGSAGEQYWNAVDGWQEDRSFEAMCPEGLPTYLKDLFRSNLGALLAVLSSRRPS